MVRRPKAAVALAAACAGLLPALASADSAAAFPPEFRAAAASARLLAAQAQSNGQANLFRRRIAQIAPVLTALEQAIRQINRIPRGQPRPPLEQAAVDLASREIPVIRRVLETDAGLIAGTRPAVRFCATEEERGLILDMGAKAAFLADAADKAYPLVARNYQYPFLATREAAFHAHYASEVLHSICFGDPRPPRQPLPPLPPAR